MFNEDLGLVSGKQALKTKAFESSPKSKNLGPASALKKGMNEM